MTAKGLLTVLLISLLTSLEIPVAHAAPCSVEYGTVSGNLRYAKFVSGNSCTWTVPTGVSSISYLVVGGGGGGGGAASTSVSNNLGGGGGGAGGIVSSSTLSVSPAGTITLTVGTGGSAGSAGSSGGNGGGSTLIYSSTTITSAGGSGGAGSPGSGDQNSLSGDGGSNASFSGGVNVWDGGGGGAGAGGNGVNGTDIGGQGGNGGNGGAAVANTLLTGSTIYYGGGGGGGGTPYENSNEVSGTYGTGGNSVGGNGGGYGGGGANDMRQPTSPVTNSGGGGGGGGWRSSWSNAQRAGSAGADGIIVITFTKNQATINSVSITSNAGADNTYKIGDVISLTLVASEAIFVSGYPRFPVVGLTSKYFSYASGTGTSSIVFTYTVASSDSASAGVGVSANALSLNSGTLLDSANLSLVLTHSAIAQASNHKVDGILPSFSGVTQSFSMPENETRTINLTTTESATLQWAGVYDRNYFILNTSVYPATLTITARDFENKQDGDSDNIYYVGITLTDLAGNSTGSFNFNITITDVVETANIGTPTLSATPIKGIQVTISVTSEVSGRVDFYWNGKKIAGCLNRQTTGSAPAITATCAWKPASTATAKIYAVVKPTSSSYTAGTTSTIIVKPAPRGSLR